MLNSYDTFPFKLLKKLMDFFSIANRCKQQLDFHQQFCDQGQSDAKRKERRHSGTIFFLIPIKC